jgi:hypothetical protein
VITMLDAMVAPARAEVTLASVNASLGGIDRRGWQRSGAPCLPMMDTVASSLDSYPLCGWLYCVCGERFFPSSAADSTREYMSVCGCRLRPIDAATVERRVYARAAHLVPPSASRWRERVEEALARLYARIEVGGTVDDVRFIPRT